MTRKFKALGLALVAALAVAAISGLSASAETGGHFVSDVAHPNIIGEENATDRLHFNADSSSVTCDQASYSGTITSSTAESITVTPTYHTCRTSNHGDTTVSMNGCQYTFTIGKKPEGHNTVHVICPTGNSILVDGPNCDLRMPAQTPTGGGVAYKTITLNEKHAITLEATVTGIHYTRHNGICVFLGTNGTTATMTGAALVRGTNTEGAPVNVTATG